MGKEQISVKQHNDSSVLSVAREQNFELLDLGGAVKGLINGAS